ncbi:uncharacterized protein EMH_0048120 [Eimeria mitis]|uniref:Uncharacterized protein n=1 Tax=Eimeria mitis TaxID=44415 RepID=U6JYX3_9EIME|nr:uncharacterized protein EMH_0048120 [Eimeria mitis]CDJ29252.1 hypothetical protein EMH_0048120 [Eimeria mitis]
MPLETLRQVAFQRRSLIILVKQQQQQQHYSLPSDQPLKGRDSCCAAAAAAAAEGCKQQPLQRTGGEDIRNQLQQPEQQQQLQQQPQEQRQDYHSDMIRENHVSPGMDWLPGLNVAVPVSNAAEVHRYLQLQPTLPAVVAVRRCRRFFTAGISDSAVKKDWRPQYDGLLYRGSPAFAAFSYNVFSFSSGYNELQDGHDSLYWFRLILRWGFQYAHQILLRR